MTQRKPGSFFERIPNHSPGRESLLLISFHFSPSPAAGALRWQKLAKRAAAHGFGLDVITLDPRELPSYDPAEPEDLPDGTRVYGVPFPRLPIEQLGEFAWRPLRWLRHASSFASSSSNASGATARPSSISRRHVSFSPLSTRSWIRAYKAWLEFARENAWAERAREVGRQLVDSNTHRAIVSCGPPHMAHEGARQLAEATGLPLVVDLRDPWFLQERLHEELASPLWFWLAAKFESRVLRRASLVVTNTEPARDAMQRRYPDLAERMISVTNGWDDDLLPAPRQDGRFLLAYAGTVYLDRSPRPLFRAAAQLVQEFGLTPDDLGIEFMGTILDIDGVSVERMASEEGLSGFVAIHPQGTREQVAEFLARAAVLVSLPQDSHLAIPSKIFEYMRYDASVLALVDPGSATELLLRDTEADVVSPIDVDGLTAVLRRRYREHAAGQRPKPLSTQERFSRRTQADRLFAEIARRTNGRS